MCSMRSSAAPARFAPRGRHADRDTPRATRAAATPSPRSADQAKANDEHGPRHSLRRMTRQQRRIGEAEVIVLATPVDAAVAWLQTIETDAVVTSTCSVMRPLRQAARGAFVAGLESGQRRRAYALVHDCGAVLERVDAEEHDAAVALTSHLPQVLSTALAAHLHGRGELYAFPCGWPEAMPRSGRRCWPANQRYARAARGGDRRAGGVRSSRRMPRDAFEKGWSRHRAQGVEAKKFSGRQPTVQAGTTKPRKKPVRPPSGTGRASRASWGMLLDK